MAYYLDMRFPGVIMPLVNTPEETVAIVAAVRLPQGRHSAGSSWLLWHAADYFARANAGTFLAVMLETRTARAEGILRVPGVDGSYIGTGDLALGSPDDSRHEEAAQQVIGAGKRVGMACSFGTLDRTTA